MTGKSPMRLPLLVSLACLVARLDAVRIKVALTGDAAARAVSALGLVPDGDERAVFFCEQVGAAVPDLPLYDRGLILRLRQDDSHSEQRRTSHSEQRHTSHSEQRRTSHSEQRRTSHSEQRHTSFRSTVELRPCRRGRLAARWLGPDRRLRLEDDWASDRVLAASLDARLGSGAVEAVLTGHFPVRRLFTAAQHAFLAECADLPVPVDDLAVLGPVRVRRCDRVRWHGYDVAAEWWDTPGGDDILRLSLRVEVPGAEVVWRGFDARLLGQGIEQRLGRRTTRVVLERLVRGWRGALL
jgi:hypothetical protein